MTSEAVKKLESLPRTQWAWTDYPGDFREFDGIEIAYVRESDGLCEAGVTEEEADFISIYGHFRPVNGNRGVECLGDFLEDVKWDEAYAIAEKFAESIGLKVTT